MRRISLFACAVVLPALPMPVAGAHGKDLNVYPRQKDVHHGRGAAVLFNAVRDR